MSKSLILIVFFAALTIIQPVPCYASRSAEVVILETMPVPVVQDFSRYFAEKLTNLCNEKGDDCHIRILDAAGNRDTAERLLKASIEEAKPDLVVSIATLASQAANEVLRGTDIPQLFGVVADPVGAGLIEEVGIPSKDNLTGLTAALPRNTQLNFAVKLGKQIVRRRPVHIGIVSSDYPSSLGDIRMLREAAAQRKDIVIQDYLFPYQEMPDHLDDMLAEAELGIRKLETRVDFWWEVSGPLGEVPDFVQMMLEASDKPVLYGNSLNSVKAGALFGMMQNVEKSAAEAADLAKEILEGADPGLIPVLPPKNFTLGVNLQTALMLDIVIPPEMLELAGRNVYR